MIYFIQEQSTFHIKIGFTAGDPLARLRELQVGNHAPLVLLAAIPGDRAFEATLHRMFAADNVQGEWFRPSATLLQTLLQYARKTSIPMPAPLMVSAEDPAPYFLLPFVGARDDLPLYQRTLIYGFAATPGVDEEHLFCPAGMAPVPEETAYLAATWDSVPIVQYEGHNFLPLCWLEQEYPSEQTLWGLLHCRLEDMREFLKRPALAADQNTEGF